MMAMKHASENKRALVTGRSCGIGAGIVKRLASEGAHVAPTSRQQCGNVAMAPVDDSKLEHFDRTLAVNVRAVFVATQAAVKHMREGERIQYPSTNAERMPFEGGAGCGGCCTNRIQWPWVFTFEDKLA